MINVIYTGRKNLVHSFYCNCHLFSGILEIKNGQVILKKQGLPILNAAIKPVPKGEIESFLDKRDSKLQQVRKYSQTKTVDLSADEQSGSFIEQPSDSTIDLDDTFTDVSQTTLQGID